MKNKIIIIPDSFKGSMSSEEVASILNKEAGKYTDFSCDCIPIADGGEGSVDCLLNILGGRREYRSVKSPENADIQAYYGITGENVAVIEIAQSSGITKQTGFCTKKTTTYGFGQLIEDALDKGCRTIYLCLGGSATTDGGCGMAAALGIRFCDRDGKEFVPVGETLSEIANIDFGGLDPRVKETGFIVMSDVENPLYGPLGAANVYAPQKGASREDVELLDAGLKHLCEVLTEAQGVDYSIVRGGGAAGGVGCGCVAFLGAKMQSGIETMLELSRFDERKKDAAMIITGEGKLDEQSLMGKVLSGIKSHAGDIPIVTFCGISDLNEEEAKKNKITVIEIGRGIPLEESIQNGKKYLQKKAEEFFRNRRAVE